MTIVSASRVQADDEMCSSSQVGWINLEILIGVRFFLFLKIKSKDFYKSYLR